MKQGVQVRKENERKSENGFKCYWLSALLGTLAVSGYPIYMGIKVLCNMAMYGHVPQESYPKYIIPYTPVAIAVIVAVCLMPLLFKRLKQFSLLAASGIAVVVFFVTELLFEQKVIVQGTRLESWQMFMCYVSPEMFQTREWRAVDILIGDYSPTFKIHFYLISVVLIIAIINCLYGFGQMVVTGNRARAKALTVQSVCTALFLGLCILACFTAFFRDGEITVSVLSAVLMSLFFVVLGVTVGSYTGSFLLGKKKSVSVVLPSAVGSLVTLAMYIGEMFLLSGHLYRFGTGFFFEGIPGIVLAPVDLVIILLAGGVSGWICYLLNKR